MKFYVFRLNFQTLAREEFWVFNTHGQAMEAVIKMKNGNEDALFEIVQVHAKRHR